MDEAVMEDPLRGHERFRTERILNRGAFGLVCLAYDNRGCEQVAIKFLPLVPPLNQHVERELMNHRQLSHPHVIQFKGVFLTAEYLGIILEYAPGGDLLKWREEQGQISEEHGRWFFQQLMIGLDYIHRMGIANRDIKLENTLLLKKAQWPILKICDFGYSKLVTGSGPKSLVGTRPYLAPEVISELNGPHKYDGFKADIWSAGVFLYVMLFDTYPFENPETQGQTSEAEVVKRIRAVEYQIPPNKVSEECEGLIKSILVGNPDERPTITDIQESKWYQIGLPPGATDIDEFLSQVREDVQSVEDIMSIIETARQDGERLMDI